MVLAWCFQALSWTNLLDDHDLTGLMYHQLNDLPYFLPPQEAAMMRRRIARMNTMMGLSASATGPGADSVAVQQQAGPPQAVMQQQQPHPGQPMVGMQPQQPQQAVIQQQQPNKPMMNHAAAAAKPGAQQQPGPGVQEALKKVQEEANRQSNNFGKGSPQMISQVGLSCSSSTLVMFTLNFS